MRIDAPIITGSFSLNGDTFNDLGAYTTTGSNTFIGNQSIVGAVSASALTGSISYTNLTNVPTLVSGSEQIVSILSPLNSFTASNYTTNTFTSSATARLNALESTSASVDSLNITQNTRLTNLENKTGSLATTGSNIFYGNQTISGTVYIQSDLIVQGSSCIQNITGSSLNIGTNIVSLNTATPSVRYAGMTVQDSGSSAGVTGSMLWDSLCNRWIYSNPSTIGYSGGMILSGPRASTLGTETTLTCNYIAKSGGGDHLYDSCIYENNGNVGINTVSPDNITTYKSLHIVGGGVSTGGIFTTSTSDGSLKGRFLTSGGEISIGAVTNSPVVMFTNDTVRMTISNSGIVCFSCQICSSNVTTSNTDAYSYIQSKSNTATVRLNVGCNGSADVFIGRCTNTVYANVLYVDTTNWDGTCFKWSVGMRTGGSNYQIYNEVLSTNALFICQSNNYVGIGTSTPLTSLTVKSTNDNGYALTRPSNGDVYHWRLSTTETGGDAYTVRYNTFNNEMLFSTYSGGGTGGNIIFRTSTIGGSETERFRINCNGIATFSCQLCVPYISVKSSDNSILGRFSGAGDYAIFAAGANAPDYQASDMNAVLNLGTRCASPLYLSLAAKGGAIFASAGGSVIVGATTANKGLLRVAGDSEICKTLFFNGGEGTGGAIINAGVQLSCSTPSYNLRSMFAFNNQANYGAFMFIHTAYNISSGKQGTVTGIVTNASTQIVTILGCALEAGVSAPGVYSTSFFCLTFCWPNSMNSNTKFIALAG